MSRIERWHFGNEMGQALSRLNATRGMPVIDRFREIQRIVEEEGGRVYRVMWHVVRDLRQRMEGQPGMAPFVSALEAQVTLNNEGNNISDAARIPVTRVLEAFIVALNSKLEREAADMDHLWLLFSGSTGMDLATRTMVDPIMAAIGAPRN